MRCFRSQMSQFSPPRCAGVIQIVVWSGRADYVNITIDGSGSGERFSNVGMVGGEQTLDFGSGCTVATWLHEKLANADFPNLPGNFTEFSYDYQMIGLYDYASVMHYCAFCFPKVELPVLESIPVGMPLRNDSGYSAGDMDEIERLYGAAPSKDITSFTVAATVRGKGGVNCATLSPCTLSFASTVVGSTLAAQTVALENTGTATLTIASIAIGGIDPSFTVPSNSCGSTFGARRRAAPSPCRSSPRPPAP
jgi:hypothetical protein